MSNKNKVPIDAYSADEFKSNLGSLTESGVEYVPPSVEREIQYTEPAVRGDTSGKVLKPAKLKTGFMVQVPLFCATGDRIEIDTRTGEYRRRV